MLDYVIQRLQALDTGPSFCVREPSGNQPIHSVSLPHVNSPVETQHNDRVTLGLQNEELEPCKPCVSSNISRIPGSGMCLYKAITYLVGRCFFLLLFLVGLFRHVSSLYTFLIDWHLVARLSPVRQVELLEPLRERRREH